MSAIDFDAIMAEMKQEATRANERFELFQVANPVELSQHVVAGVGGGSIFYIPEFITASEESKLVSCIYDEPARWQRLTGRRLQMWGGTPSPAGMVQESLPSFLAALAEHLVQSGLFDESPNQVLLNEYTPPQGIAPHKDGPLYRPHIAILSMLGDAVINFTTDPEGTQIEGSLLLRARSLLVFKGVAYEELYHTIPSCKHDTVTEDTRNRHAANSELGDVLQRRQRLSLTMRCAKGAHSAMHTEAEREELDRRKAHWYRAISEAISEDG